MFTSLQNPLALASRLLLAALFLPAGIGKLTGFAGTVGYITSVGLPMPTVAAAVAAAVAGAATNTSTDWPIKLRLNPPRTCARSDPRARRALLLHRRPRH